MGTPLFIREYVCLLLITFFGTLVAFLLFRDKKVFKFEFLLVLVLTAVYFSGNFLLFIVVLFPVIYLGLQKNSATGKISYYFFLLPFLPIALQQKIPFPGLEQLVTINYQRALNIYILLPIFLGILSRPKKAPLKSMVDKCVILYFAYIFIIAFRRTTFTNSFRFVFEIFIDHFILYFVVSRLAGSVENFEKFFKSIINSALILAFIGIFETVKNWRMFDALFMITRGGAWEQGYSSRQGVLRAGGFLNPIVFGVYLYIAIAFLIFLIYSGKTTRRIPAILVICILFFGIFCSLSRSPLTGAAIFFLCFVLLEKQKLLKLASIALIVCSLLIISPLGKGVISSLPFIGKEDQGSITYRKILWENALIVIKRSPLLGNIAYANEPEIEALKRSGGRLASGGVDIVNSYLGIALTYGIIGISIFVSILSLTIINLWKAIHLAKDKTPIMLGHILFSLTASLLIVLVTTSQITIFPFLIWILIGFSMGYSYMVKEKYSAKIE